MIHTARHGQKRRSAEGRDGHLHSTTVWIHAGKKSLMANSQYPALVLFPRDRLPGPVSEWGIISNTRLKAWVKDLFLFWLYLCVCVCFKL